MCVHVCRSLFSHLYIKKIFPSIFSFPPTVFRLSEGSREEGSYDTAKKNHEDGKETEYKREQATVDEAVLNPWCGNEVGMVCGRVRGLYENFGLELLT